MIHLLGTLMENMQKHMDSESREVKILRTNKTL